MRRSRAAVAGWQIAILVAGLSVWEWGWDVARATLPKPWVPKILDPYFISKPSAIWRSFLRLGCLADKAGFVACIRENANNLWLATLVTLKNMCWGFLWGASLGALAGLVLGRSEYLARIFAPYIVAMNSIPRIALVPLIILICGLGDL